MFGFHLHEPDYGVVEIFAKDLNGVLDGTRHALRKSDSRKSKYVVDQGNGRIIRLIVWNRFTFKGRLTCEMYSKFACPDYSRRDIEYMNSVKVFDLVDLSWEDLSCDESKGLLKKCVRIVEGFRGWTPTIRLRSALYRVSREYILDDYYMRIIRLVVHREKAIVFWIFPGLPRDIYEIIFRFLDPASYETLRYVL